MVRGAPGAVSASIRSTSPTTSSASRRQLSSSSTGSHRRPRSRCARRAATTRRLAALAPGPAAVRSARLRRDHSTHNAPRDTDDLPLPRGPVTLEDQPEPVVQAGPQPGFGQLAQDRDVPAQVLPAAAERAPPAPGQRDRVDQGDVKVQRGIARVTLGGAGLGMGVDHRQQPKALDALRQVSVALLADQAVPGEHLRRRDDLERDLPHLGRDHRRHRRRSQRRQRRQRLGEVHRQPLSEHRGRLLLVAVGPRERQHLARVQPVQGQPGVLGQPVQVLDRHQRVGLRPGERVGQARPAVAAALRAQPPGRVGAVAGRQIAPAPSRTLRRRPSRPGAPPASAAAAPGR